MNYIFFSIGTIKTPLSVNRAAIIIDITDDSAIINKQNNKAEPLSKAVVTFFSLIENFSNARQHIV